jgi:hypothetical protein
MSRCLLVFASHAISAPSTAANFGSALGLASLLRARRDRSDHRTRGEAGQVDVVQDEDADDDVDP